MSNRKPRNKAADLSAIGKRIANSLATANERLEYWFDLLCPEWRPDQTGIEAVHDTTNKPLCVIPTMSTKLDGARRYVIAVLGYSSDEVGAMTPAEMIDILRREVESRETDDNSRPPDVLLARLTKLEVRLLAHLWEEPNARISALHESVWKGKTVEDASIIKAAERLNNKLAKMPDYCHIAVSHSGDFIVLDK